MSNSLHLEHPRKRRGLLLLISSPSGAGKTSLSRRLVTDHPDLALSISATTRPPRPGEEDGREYFFVNDAEFQRMVDAEELAEWAYVFDHRYGSPKEPIKDALKDGRDILFDIDYQGTLQLYEKCRADMVTVFILPPTITELRARLERRAQDSKAAIARRLKNARIEMDHYREYDYVLVNEDLEDSTRRVRSILAAARLKRERLLQLDNFVRDLQNQIDSL